MSKAHYPRAQVNTGSLFGFTFHGKAIIKTVTGSDEIGNLQVLKSEQNIPSYVPEAH